MLEIINGFISCLITVITLYIFGRLIIKNNSNQETKDFLFILIATIFNTIVFLYTGGTLKTMLTCVVYILFFKFTFNLKLEKAIFDGVFYIIITVIPDLIMTYIPIYAFKIEKEVVYSNFAGSILGSLCVGVLMIVLTYLLKNPLRKIINYKLSTNKKIMVVSIATIIFVTIFFYKFANDFRIDKEVIFYLIAIFAFISILFTLFREKIENENILNKYDDLLTIMRDYESDVEEQRTILHETRNELKTVRSMVNDKNSKKQVIEYIDSVLADKNGGDMKKYSKFKYLPSNGIKGFFYYKFMEAERLGVNANVFVAKDIEKSFLKDLDIKTFKDLGRILGVYLDNAIEASASSDKKELGLEVYLKNNAIEIIISNTFNNDINLNEMGNNYSTKGIKRGHGLLLVKRILINNRHFISENNIIKDIYVQKIIIKEKTQ